MNKQWNHTVNPILTATEESYSLTLTISTFHFDALASKQTDPFFGPLFTAYTPIHAAYKAAYANWITQEGSQTGKTLNLTQLLKLLSGTKVRNWDIAIQGIHPHDTPAYKSILSNNRIPFQHGTQDERINAVKSLSQALIGIAALATTKTDVDSFYTQIDAANNAQKASKTSTNSLSNAVETARINMCTAQFANLGALINRFAATPKVIDDYFDLKNMRRAAQVHFTGHIKPQLVHTIMKHTFGITDEVTLENKGTTDLLFYLAPTKDALHKTDTITLHPGEQQTMLASALGLLTDTHLMVYNTHPIEKGEFIVELN